MPSAPVARLLARLETHQPSDEDEAAGLERMKAFLRSCPAPFARATAEGHVTGAAMVLDPAGRALLLHHAKLGLWVQPGGHLEPFEEDPAQAGLREATEETGLADLELDAGRIFDVDVHPIPANAKRGEAAHFHHDVCFVARTRTPNAARIDPNESLGMRWVSPDELDGLSLDRATLRRLRKVFSR